MTILYGFNERKNVTTILNNYKNSYAEKGPRV